LCMLVIERELSEVLLKDPTAAIVDEFAELNTPRLSLQKH